MPRNISASLLIIIPSQVYMKKFRTIERRALREVREAAAAREAIRNHSRRVKRLFERTVKTWEHKVEFTVETSTHIGDEELVYFLRTDDQIWHWVNEGTDASYVAVNPGYVLKTHPADFNSYAGGGGVHIVGRHTGVHKGIYPRGWTAPIFVAGFREQLKQEYRKKIDALIKEINAA